MDAGQPSCGGEKSGLISLFPCVSYSEKNSLILVGGDCCLLFNVFVGVADFVLIKDNLILESDYV